MIKEREDIAQKRNESYHKRRNSYIGVKSNRLTITGFLEPKIAKGGYRIYMVSCMCECGNTYTTRLHSVTSGRVSSCGCLQRELAAIRTETHGLSKTRIYNIFAKMKDRCYNPKTTRYYNYGGRGIKICQEWLDDVTVFYKWAIENGYNDSLQIDRYPNNNGNYEPGNCRFTTRKNNQRNRRNTVFITHNGKTMCIPQWSEEMGIDSLTLSRRYKQGITGDELFKPTKNRSFLTNDQRIKILEDVRNNLPTKEIMRRHGLKSSATINRYKQRFSSETLKPFEFRDVNIKVRK